jgi:hypothetical protein
MGEMDMSQQEQNKKLIQEGFDRWASKIVSLICSQMTLNGRSPGLVIELV